MATKQAEGRTHNGRPNWPSEVATASSRSGRRGMTRLATSRNMGLQGWRPLLSPKPTDPLTTLVGKYLHILCLLRLHGRFYLLILQKRAGRPVGQAVLQLLERLSQQQSQTYQRTTAAIARVITHEVLPCTPRMPNTEDNYPESRNLHGLRYVPVSEISQTERYDLPEGCVKLARQEPGGCHLALANVGTALGICVRGSLPASSTACIVTRTGPCGSRSLCLHQPHKDRRNDLERTPSLLGESIVGDYSPLQVRIASEPRHMTPRVDKPSFIKFGGAWLQRLPISV